MLLCYLLLLLVRCALAVIVCCLRRSQSYYHRLDWLAALLAIARFSMVGFQLWLREYVATRSTG